MRGKWNLGLKWKISLGFGAPVVLVVAYASLVLSGITGSQVLEKIAVAIDNVRIAELESRRNEKDFLLRKDEKYIDKHHESVQWMRDHFEVVSSYDWNEEDRARLDLLAQAIENYQAGFLSVAEAWKLKGLDEKSGLRGRLRNAVHEIESAIEELGLPAEVKAQMLMCRRREKDYIIRGQDKYVDKLKVDAALLGEYLVTHDASALLEPLASYQSAFMELTEVDRQIRTEIAIFREQIHQLDPILTEVQNSVVERAMAHTARLKTTTIALSAVVVSVCALIGFLVMRGVLNPLRPLMRSIIALGEGDLSQTSGISSSDEIGRMGMATDRSICSLKDMIGRVTGSMESLSSASGQLSAAATEVAATITDIGEQSGSIAKSATEASENIGEITVSIRNNNEAIDMVAASIEEMNSTVNEIALNCQKESSISAKANQQAKSTSETMKALESSANEIGRVLEVINDIANKTNLLALNATIEAASAGDAGKGFAVVATEVKELAKQTSQATDEIGGLIENIRSNTTLSVDAIENIVVIVEEVNVISQNISSAVEEQSASIREISKNVNMTNDSSRKMVRNVEESTQGITRISSNINDLTEAVQGISLVVSLVEGNAGELDSLSDGLEDSLSSFKV